MTQAYLLVEIAGVSESEAVPCESFAVRCGDCVSWYRVQPSNTLIGICENVLCKHCEHVLAARHVSCERFERRPPELDEEDEE
ncbi:hypothetical protein HZA56_03415 [Candidatus Poribacteria bacterium]|nr:hypothetical protein [Candidatus Poribacteria bacterium]